MIILLQKDSHELRYPGHLPEYVKTNFTRSTLQIEPCALFGKSPQYLLSFKRHKTLLGPNEVQKLLQGIILPQESCLLH